MIQRFNRFLRILGPGLITGASDDDPSGITTYSQAGATYGLKTLWTSWVTLPLMIAVLEMFARLSLVSSLGLAGNIKKHYSPYFLYFILLLNIPAVILNIGADLAGMGAVANMFFPSVPRVAFCFLFTVLLTLSLIFLSYRKIAATLKWLCIVLFVYFVVPFMVKQDWKAIGYSTLVPTFEWTKDYFYIIVAIIGTTISPYLFFWQSSISLEHRNHRHLIPHIDVEMSEMKLDINTGMWISNLVMFFIILTTGSVLFPNGITNIQTVDEAAEALRPLAGDWAWLLFALGVIGTGLLAIPVLAASVSYLVSDSFHWAGSMSKTWREARKFYGVLIATMLGGFLLSSLDIDPITSMILTAATYGVICPLLIGVVLHLCNKHEVMGGYVNSRLANFFGILALFITAGAVLGLFVFTLLG